MKKINILFMLILLLHGNFVYGKTKVFSNGINIKSIADLTNISELERKVTPFFESLLMRRHADKKSESKNSTPLREDEIILAMKHYTELSTSFQKLYKKAISISDSFNVFISPSGHFEIYYTINGINAVDTTDNYHYDKLNWRVKKSEPNGVPDYVDECAFSLDSCWSMIIEKFGFYPPHPYKDEKHPSDLYKVIIELQEESYYGFTYLFEPQSNTIGYRSLLSIRNNWSDVEWSELGYDKNPINGLRVTCAHEFFHSIQYSMSHQVTMDVFLDEFPLSWTEGTAVCMEELAFDSINDYHQYATTYFSNPSLSFFNFPISDIVYTNAILLIYITKHFPPDGKATFIKLMHENNYKERTAFYINLFNTCDIISNKWVDILHSFHCKSFFTGKFSDTASFIPDASFFTMKTPQIYSLQNPIKKKLSPNSAAHIGFIPSENQIDSLKIKMYVDSISEPNELKISLMKQKNGTIEFVPLTLSSDGTGSYTLQQWKELQMAALIITNGNPVREREVQVEFEIDSTVVNYNSKEILVYPNPVSKRRDGGVLYVVGDSLKALYMYSLGGTLIKKKTSKVVSSLNKNGFVLDCSEYSAGSYLLVISKESSVADSIKYSKQKLIIAP